MNRFISKRGFTKTIVQLYFVTILEQNVLIKMYLEERVNVSNDLVSWTFFKRFSMQCKVVNLPCRKLSLHFLVNVSDDLVSWTLFARFFHAMQGSKPDVMQESSLHFLDSLPRLVSGNYWPRAQYIIDRNETVLHASHTIPHAVVIQPV